MEDAKKAKERGMTYEKDMAGPKVKTTDRSVKVIRLDVNNEGEKVICQVTEDNVDGKEPTPEKKKTTKCTESICATCGEKGHSRNTHKDCLKSTNTQSRFFRKYKMCIYIRY